MYNLLLFTFFPGNPNNLLYNNFQILSASHILIFSTNHPGFQSITDNMCIQSTHIFMSATRHISNVYTSISYTFIYKCIKQPKGIHPTVLNHLLSIEFTLVPLLFSSYIHLTWFSNQPSIFMQIFHTSTLLTLAHAFSKSVNIQ